MGIPIITIFTCFHAYSKLERTGVTTWDRDLGWTVVHSEMGLGRWVGVACAWVAFILVLLVAVGLGFQPSS